MYGRLASSHHACCSLAPLLQLLAPVREAINSLLHCYWRKAKLDSVRLHTITSRLLAFLLSHSGQVLCSSFEPLG